MKKFLLTSALLLSLSIPAKAAIVANLGLDPNLSVARNFTSGLFDDQYIFSLDATKTITIVGITNTFAGGVTGSRFIQNFTGTVFSDGPDGLPGGGDDFAVIGPTLATSPCGSVINCQSLAGSATLDAGAYYFDLSGTGGALASYGGNITTIAVVPEASTWAMMLLGFAGIGLFSSRKRRSLRLA